MYLDIHQLKKMGLNKAQIARKTGISRTTVHKYLGMTPDEYQQILEGMDTRKKKLDDHHERIVSWLQDYPDLSASQVMDWLLERKLLKKNLVSESTVRNFVRQIRKAYGITKQVHKRDYEAVPELPMGQQMQVDFGQTQERDQHGYLVKLWFITFVLSCSRYKYVLWQENPFTTADVIVAHEQAFEYIVGIPKEIVYDQDSLMLVNENHGDLIYTQGFAAYVKERRFEVHMCRKADPQSKGKVENVVKYVKQHFARHRTFITIDQWQEDCLAWLDRAANGKKHQTTKKIPHEVFQQEQTYLRPANKKLINQNVSQSITRVVRKDNTISFESNRYSVPLGTYSGQHPEVGLRIAGHELIIYDSHTGQEIARHERSMDKGQLIQNNHHRRDRSKGIDAYLEHVANVFPEPDKARDYLETIRTHKPRYIRDPLQLILKHTQDASTSSLNQALVYCQSRNLYQATDLVDAMAHFNHTGKAEEVTMRPVIPSHLPWQASVKPEIRDMNIYRSVMKGDTHDNHTNRSTQAATQTIEVV